VELQEFCKGKEAAVLKRIEEVMNTADTTKLSKEGVEVLLDEILAGFALRQPSDYFLTNPTDDTECSFSRDFFAARIEETHGNIK
jgi:hypothetical protein